MRDVVDTLETQHRALEQEVAALQQALTSGELPPARAALDRLQAMLTVHIQLEHTDFYPRFIALAEAEAAATATTVRLFEENLRRIADGLLAFFKRWAGPLEQPKLETLKTEWAGILKLLMGRLRDEEQTLHPIWRRLSARAPGAR